MWSPLWGSLLNHHNQDSLTNSLICPGGQKCHSIHIRTPHSSKLRNWGPEIGFLNLSLLIQSRQFKLRGTAHCLLGPHTNETSGNLLICLLRLKGLFGRPFYFLNQLSMFPWCMTLIRNVLKGPLFFFCVFATWQKKVYTFLQVINRASDTRSSFQSLLTNRPGHLSLFWLTLNWTRVLFSTHLEFESKNNAFLFSAKFYSHREKWLFIEGFVVWSML